MKYDKKEVMKAKRKIGDNRPDKFFETTAVEVEADTDGNNVFIATTRNGRGIKARLSIELLEQIIEELKSS